MSKRKKSSGENAPASSSPAAKADADVVEPKAPAPPQSDAPTVDESLLPESQHQRWIKYGANVALTTIVVLALAAAAAWAATGTTQMREKLNAGPAPAIDGSNNLKP